jgi:sugar fermentation stimulation protein A
VARSRCETADRALPISAAQRLCLAAMRFGTPLIPAMLARRYKRFLADVMLESGEMMTVHVPNPGAMTGLARPYSQVWLSDSDNPMRTLRYTWELVETDLGSGLELVGVNTVQPNLLTAEAISAGLVPELCGYSSTRREVKYGTNSRTDFLLEDPKRPACYLEVKNVHLMRRSRLAEFPDSVTARGAKHLDELAAMAEGGARSVLLFVIQISSADRFAVAHDIDPAYAAAFDRARAKGVEMLAWRCKISVEGIEIAAPVPIVDA